MSQSQEEPSISKPSQKKAGRPKELSAPVDLNPPVSRSTPTDRLVETTREHINSLEKDRSRFIQSEEQLHAEMRRFQTELRRLDAENARLRESLGNAVANSNLSFFLITVGGAAISFATFAIPVDKAVAYIGAG